MRVQVHVWLDSKIFSSCWASAVASFSYMYNPTQSWAGSYSVLCYGLLPLNVCTFIHWLVATASGYVNVCMLMWQYYVQYEVALCCKHHIWRVHKAQLLRCDGDTVSRDTIVTGLDVLCGYPTACQSKGGLIAATDQSKFTKANRRHTCCDEVCFLITTVTDNNLQSSLL